MKRHKMDRHGSKSHFARHAARTHYKNMPRGMPMRGGIRM